MMVKGAAGPPRPIPDVPGSLDLMKMHVEALFAHDGDGHLVAVNEPGGEPAPRFFLGHTSAGRLSRFRHDVDPELRALLESLAEQEVGDGRGQVDPAPFVRALSERGTVEKVWEGPAYYASEAIPGGGETALIDESTAELLEPHFGDWISDVADCHPFLARIHDGVAVSICTSVRITDDAHEAGVETAPDWRGHGFAGHAVAAWAAAVRAADRVPLYSTSWTNTASMSVAAKTGLVKFGADLHIR